MLLLRVACTHKHGAKCHKLLQTNSLGHKQRIYDFALMPEHIQGHWMLKHVAMKTGPLYIRFPVAIICHQHHVANKVPGVCLCKETQKTGTGCFQYLSEKVQKNLRDYCKYISKYLTTSKLILLTQHYKMLILIVVKLFASIDVVKNHHRLVFKVLGSWTADHEFESPQSFVHTCIYRVKFLKINRLFKIAYFLPIWLIYTSYASCYLS